MATLSPSSGRSFNLVRSLRQAARDPRAVLSLALVALLVVFVLVPIIRLISATFVDGGLSVWQRVLTSNLSTNLLWRPMLNTLIIGLLVAVGSVLLGGFMAWLVIMTDVPGRKWLGALSAIPTALPTFAVALAWETIFRNDRVGGTVGLIQGLGIDVPDWLSWGLIPIAVTLIAHYYSLAFNLISASLASVNTELLEAADMTGASRMRVLRDVTLPIVTPAIVSSALLAFAEGVSNFAAPALLGSPVRFQTISTRLFGMIQTGQTEVGYALSLTLIVLAAGLLWLNIRLIGGRRSFATMTGKGARRKRTPLGVWRMPAFVLGFALTAATTIVPGIALLISSLSRRTGSLSAGLTLHYWIGDSNPDIAQGQAGVINNPQVLGAALNTLLLGVFVAIGAMILGLLIGYVVVRSKDSPLAQVVGGLSFVPFLIPGVAFGALYIALFGRPIGPLPALYGTLALLVIAGVAYSLPFTSQAGRAAISQIARDLEEAATMTGASFGRRLLSIVTPLASRGLIAGAVLVFVQMARDLSLVVLLATPATAVLSIVAFQYASEGFAQFANAITLMIASLSVAVTLVAQRLQAKSQPWVSE
jgi:iron(III) transport system permease protein